MTNKAASMVLWGFTAMNQRGRPGIRPMSSFRIEDTKLGTARCAKSLRTEASSVELENGRKPVTHSTVETS